MTRARKTEKGEQPTSPQRVSAAESAAESDVVPDEPVEGDLPLVWAVDPDATWWDDVWPFVDETELIPQPTPEPADEEVEEVEEAEAEAETGVDDQPEADLEPDLEPEPEPQPEPQPEDRSVALAAFLAPVARERPGRSRRWVAVLASGAVVVAGVVWFATDRQGGEQARLTRTDTFAAPVRLAPDTSVVQSRVLASGDLLVTHWIRSRKAVHTVTIRTPRVPGLAPGVVHPGQVVLAANGLLSPSVGQPRGADLVTYRIPAAHRVYVRYQISGAVQRAGPDGRALARITSLDVETGAALDETTRTVVGARVLSLACSSPAPGAVAVPCGSDDGGSWSVRLGRRAGADRVMAQLDLS